MSLTRNGSWWWRRLWTQPVEEAVPQRVDWRPVRAILQLDRRPVRFGRRSFDVAALFMVRRREVGRELTLGQTRADSAPLCNTC